MGLLVMFSPYLSGLLGVAHSWHNVVGLLIEALVVYLIARNKEKRLFVRFHWQFGKKYAKQMRCAQCAIV